MNRKSILAAISLGMLMSFASSQAIADAVYKVTITNVTGNIIFTPILVASHRRDINLFQPGHPASAELGRIAEGGDTGPMTTALEADHNVVDVANSGAPLLPGASVTVEVKAKRGANYISLASMMLPTNDGFIALNNVKAPRHHNQITYYSPGYDAGTESNDELCVSIPGPQCGGAPFSPEDDGEGYVHVHSGIHGTGDLSPATYDWNNPVASISIKRVGR